MSVDGLVSQLGGLSDAQYSLPLAHGAERQSYLTPGQMFAPIFGDFTIPPFYQIQQQPFPIAPNTVRQGYQAFGLHEPSSGGMLPVRFQERQGGFDGQ